jgi:hypothetical protein
MQANICVVFPELIMGISFVEVMKVDGNMQPSLYCHIMPCIIFSLIRKEYFWSARFMLAHPLQAEPPAMMPGFFIRADAWNIVAD